MSPPKISTEQHVPDVKKTCRFPLSVSRDVLEKKKGGGGGKEMLTCVVFPAISDVASSVKCEAFALPL